jgi:hypothetical protein
MEPTLYTGDLAVLQKREGYALGDIVAFRVNDGIVIHRIVGGSAEEGFVMQGDNKPGVDPWQPKPDEILGRMWFHIPGGGRPLQNLRQPQNLAALVALASIMFLDEGKKATLRRHGRRLRARLRGATTGSMSLVGAMDVLAVFAALTVVLAAVGVYGWWLPATKTETVPQPLYEHSASFQYTVHTAESQLYPGQVVGPVGPGNAAAAMPVVAALAQTIDLDIAYALKDAPAGVVPVDLSVVLLVKSGEDWSQTQTLLEPVPLTGAAANAHVSVDLADVRAMIDGISAEIGGYNPGSYELAIIPTVRLAGQQDGRPVNDTYAPAFTVALGATRLTFDPALARSEVRERDVAVERPNAVKLGGVAIPVMTLRAVGLAGSLTGLAVTALLAAVVFLGLGTDEAGRLRARYGHMFVAVVNANLDTGHRLEVASFQDLVRLAKRDGGFIFHEVARGNPQVFFVPDGQVIYTYRVGQSGSRS